MTEACAGDSKWHHFGDTSGALVSSARPIDVYVLTQLRRFSLKPKSMGAMTQAQELIARLAFAQVSDQLL
jgi:hypothetical protein